MSGRLPLIVGLTGNIGSGKSTAAKAFSRLGVPTFDADKVGHELLESDTNVRKKILSTFGNEVVVDGKISRRVLGQIVFADESKRAALEGILHPAIMKTITEQASAFKDSRYVIMEVPLLYEAELTEDFDYIILVKAKKDTSIHRAAEKLGISREEVLKRLATQIPQTEKEKLADFVISNDGSLSELNQRVDLLHGILTSIGRD
ncbi:MAG: dephospho-CoA kinase [Bacteroidetes bacterium]|nr:dephospho-CoA kinase [Bacteroidota bacterium]MCL5035382.1 dephospho-CoA kinase [Bacteroidota bacterium]